MKSPNYHLPDEQATLKWAAGFASALKTWQNTLPTSALHCQLDGDLGAGKTTFVRGVLTALGHHGRVRSPTYTLCEPYEFKTTEFSIFRVYHFDLYRFSSPEEWIDAGFRECFTEPALCLIEWAEKAGHLLGTPDVIIHLSVEGEGRALYLESHTLIGEQLLEHFDYLQE